jgi:hypothetical protein
MTFEKTYDIQKNNKLIIDLTERFKARKKVRVIIEDIDEQRKLKIALLKMAQNDSLFLADIAENTTVFGNSDNDSLL